MSNSHTVADLRDFSVTPRVLSISALAVLIGLASTGLAWVLLRLIGLCTNLFFYQRLDSRMTSPAANHLGWLAALVPVIGGLIVGLMARYGSDRIRGHGIPEAIEAILMNGSRVQPKLAVLKPVSAAIAIGSGGPFGAEGPIIMTGGAVGSMIAQLFHLTSAERKTLLVAGAAAGMSAVFAAPLAAILLAAELLLFEFKPRSLIPVALASITAGMSRVYVLGAGPVFAVPPHMAVFNLSTGIGCLACGVLAGFLSMVLSKSIYSVEDWFARLPLHWMWWPALGGIAVGIGGLLVPRALGVGYDVIGDLLLGHATLTLVASILVVKSAIWIASLGSGTSGGVLAPILMIGGALGGLEAIVFPSDGAGFWPMVSMAAVLAGTLQAPLTSIVFAIELTHDFNMAVPITLACFVAYAVMVLSVNRSILTEKIARRGFHLSREYSVDPLEAFLVKEAMRPLSATEAQEAFPGNAATAHPDETLRTVVYRMVDTGCDELLVVDGAGTPMGMVALRDLLSARIRRLGEERDRNRPLDLRLIWSRTRSTADVS
jgi:H+/Cl- antiporter ClcA